MRINVPVETMDSRLRGLGLPHNTRRSIMGSLYAAQTITIINDEGQRECRRVFRSHRKRGRGRPNYQATITHVNTLARGRWQLVIDKDTICLKG